MKLTAAVKEQIIQASKTAYPNEACGVMVNDTFIQLDNVSDDAQNHFEISPQQLAQVEDQGEIQAYVHSHPDGTAIASPLDKHQIELHGKPWVICAYPDVDIQMHEPCGYQAPLIGRNYYHGWQDCYSLVRDFYQRELDITLPDFERDDFWWEGKNNPSLYLNNYKSAGFYQVDSPQYGDMLVCKVGRTEHPNHALIWLGDQWQLKSEQAEPAIGNTLILHHPYNQNTKREISGHNWQERTVKILRHKDCNHGL